MRVTGAIPEAPRLLPAPAARPAVPALTQEPVRPAAPVAPRPAVWTLSGETAAAAVAAQMLVTPRRGLKADAAERARFARAYRRKFAPVMGVEISAVA